MGAASGQAGPEIWLSRTRAQTEKRLASYGDLSTVQLAQKEYFWVMAQGVRNTMRAGYF